MVKENLGQRGPILPMWLAIKWPRLFEPMWSQPYRLANDAMESEPATETKNVHAAPNVCKAHGCS